MKKLLAILLLFSAATARGIETETGPYLQAVGEHEFTVVWTTDADAVAWVEVAPDDGSDFYAPPAGWWGSWRPCATTWTTWWI